MSRKVNMVSELEFLPLMANVVTGNEKRVTAGDHSQRAAEQESSNQTQSLQRPRRKDPDDATPIYFNHSLSIKLNDHNFLLWKQKRFNPAYLDWEAQDQLLVSWLLSSMTLSLLTRMVGCESASQIWSTLEKYFTLSSLKFLSFAFEATKSQERFFIP
uniref:Retrotransposon Copia-like N-terminal domain-containing protein n=1 Tax=Cannabis sativa TaxID=3483 RepID=A0A803NSE1_CANSA